MGNSGQPRNDDAVLGGQEATPLAAVVLGGFEGVRKRLNSAIADERVAALADALQYGQRGLTLVIWALNDPAEAVRQTAYALLQNRTESRAVQAVERVYAELNYGQLRALLLAKKWQDADQETKAVLFKALGLTLSDQLRPADIEELPCRDLQLIDQLWVQCSNGRFGFSVQRSIWQPLNELYWDKAEVWGRFSDRVGWRKGNFLTDKSWKRYGELTFAAHAPTGHLPFLGDNFGIFTIEAISSRLGWCQADRTATSE